MPGTTDVGAPFPLDSDPATDGAATAQALAEWVSDYLKGIQVGAGAVPVPGGGVPGTLAVVFDEPYTAAPVVITGGIGQDRDHYAANVTAVGFDLRSVKATAGAASHTTNWVAFGTIA